MYVQLTCVIVDADQANREELAAFLTHFGAQPVAQLGSVEHLGELLSRPDAPTLAIVNLDPVPHETLKKIAAFPKQFPAASFFLMSQTVDPNLLMEAMHLGIREFIPLPISEQKFSSAVERVASMHGMGKRARIIQVVPTVGGCGSTTIACNVAASLAQSSKTVLIDLDLMRGGVASYFDTRARYTIADVMDAGEKLDKQLLDNALMIHKKSNLAILARPELPEDTQRVNQAGLTRLLNVLSRVFDYVVIDSVMSISPMYASVTSPAPRTPSGSWARCDEWAWNPSRFARSSIVS
ncbi:MAG: AAA family ATPase [Tepidisphaeraceae bacterium]